jgi:hypothetical protein
MPDENEGEMGAGEMHPIQIYGMSASRIKES